MKVTDGRPIGPTRGVGRISGARAPTRAGEVRAPRSIVDVARFLGIPEDELTPNVRAGLERLLEEVDRMRRETEQLNKRVQFLERLADEDTLTPMLNRRAFVRELSRVIAYAERYRTTSSVLYFDVNGMKDINDRYGHAAGDAALTHVANTLLANLRGSDVVGRLGGDEFGTILHQASLDTARTKGQELAQRIKERPFHHDGNELYVDVAFGAFAFDGQGSADEILDHADREMYAHKRRGRDRQY